MNKLSSQDRASLIRLASTLPIGSVERKAILAGLSGTDKTSASGGETAEKHQLKVLTDTVKNPMKGKFLGGPSAEEAEKTLREKFHFTDKQIASLKKANFNDTGKTSSGEVNVPGKHILGDAQVSGKALVYGEAAVNGNAYVYDKAKVYGDAKVSGDAYVYGDAKVSGKAKVYGEARVFGRAHVLGDAKVYGDAVVYGDAKVFGRAYVLGNAQVSDDAQVSGDAKVFGNASIGGAAKIYGGNWDGSEGEILSGNWLAPGVPA